MKTKVIQILGQSPPEYLLKTNAAGEKEVGFFESDWHVLVAARLRALTDEYDFECWRPYRWTGRPQQADINGIRHRVFPSRRIRVGRYDFGERSPELRKALYREAKRGPVIVHLHGLKNALFIDLLLRGGLGGTPVVVQSHGSYPYAVSRRKKRWLPALWTLGAVQRRAARKVGHMFVLNGEEQRAWQRVIKAPVEVQTMGVDFKQFAPLPQAEARTRCGLGPEGRYLLYAGRLAAGKGLDCLVEAFPRVLEACPETVLLLAGSGPLEAEIRGRAAAAGLEERVRLLGQVAHDELPAWYNSADVFVMPSQGSEGLGIVLLEALACGTPSVATDLPGARELVETFEGGRLVPTGSPAAIADAVITLLGQPDGFSVNRERGERRYGWDGIAGHTLDVYASLVPARSRQAGRSGK